VLSIGKLVAGAEDYYLSMVAEGHEEYYSGAGESRGTWLESGTDDLGLAGPVSLEALAAILAGIAPGTGADLGLMRRSGTRVGGFDLTFSAPRSVSLLYALGSPDHSGAVRAAHDQAVTERVAYLERPPSSPAGAPTACAGSQPLCWWAPPSSTAPLATATPAPHSRPSGQCRARRGRSLVGS